MTKKLISDESRKVFDESKGLDLLGRALLAYAVGQIDRENLPDDVIEILENLEPLSDENIAKALLKLGQVFSNSANSGDLNGEGFGIGYNSDGKVVQEIDRVVVKQDILNIEDQYHKVNSFPGTVVISAGKAKMKDIIQF